MTDGLGLGLKIKDALKERRGSMQSGKTLVVDGGLWYDGEKLTDGISADRFGAKCQFYLPERLTGAIIARLNVAFSLLTFPCHIQRQGARVILTSDGVNYDMTDRLDNEFLLCNHGLYYVYPEWLSNDRLVGIRGDRAVAHVIAYA